MVEDFLRRVPRAFGTGAAFGLFDLLGREAVRRHSSQTLTGLVADFDGFVRFTQDASLFLVEHNVRHDFTFFFVVGP